MVKIEDTEYINLQQLNEVLQAIQKRIGSHEERIMELQEQQTQTKEEYQTKYFGICKKYNLEPKERHIFEPKMNLVKDDKKVDKSMGKA
tara:strand:+ start:599 stop:865 length:267 start_codon:yes stop_codon:yes gene_type:complete